MRTEIWLPVFAGEYTPAECAGRDKYIIDGKEYDEYGYEKIIDTLTRMVESKKQ